MEPGGALDELAERYSAELKTHHHHVLEALRFQAEMAATLYDKEPRAPEVSSSASHSSLRPAGYMHRACHRVDPYMHVELLSRHYHVCWIIGHIPIGMRIELLSSHYHDAGSPSWVYAC